VANSQLFTERSCGNYNRFRWGDVEDVPFGRTRTYQLIKSGIIDSVLIKEPGKGRGRRLIDLDSLDRYLERLMAEQKAEKQAEKEVAV